MVVHGEGATKRSGQVTKTPTEQRERPKEQQQQQHFEQAEVCEAFERAREMIDAADVLPDPERLTALRSAVAAVRAEPDDFIRSRLFAHLADLLLPADEKLALWLEGLEAAKAITFDRTQRLAIRVHVFALQSIWNRIKKEDVWECIKKENETVLERSIYATHNHSKTIATEYNRQAMHIDTLPDLETTVRAFAHYSRQPESVVRALLDIDGATGEMTRRTKAKPRALWENRKGADAKLTPPAKKANRELTAVRLKATYEVLLRESDLTNPKLSNEERLRRAEHLLVTYKRLRRLVPKFHDKSGELQAARSLTNSKNYQRRKAKVAAAA
jgi:hypothetical protein